VAALISVVYDIGFDRWVFHAGDRVTTRRRGRRPVVEVLFVDGCPHHGALVSTLRDLLARTGLDAELTSRRVRSEREAVELRFLGSPTVRLDGRDVEPGAEVRTDYGMGCRLYRTADGVTGMPPDALIRGALAAEPVDGCAGLRPRSGPPRRRAPP
jgi:hypothetical protein